MTWTAYRVSFRLLSPIHSGWRKVGNLQQTRPYVTGRSLWGALTARLTREGGGSNYPKIGQEVDEQLAFTYFFPSTNSRTVELWPWPDKQWGKFAWTFLGSYASTALENGRSAEAGSLHETEFIAPYTRNYTPDKEAEPVYLVGYIFEKDNYTIKPNWQDVLDKLQFGGERSYGWGRVRLEGQCEEIKDQKCFGYELDCKGDSPALTAPDEMQQLLAHTIVDQAESRAKAPDRNVAIEPLIGRETKDGTGFGRSFSDPEICWVPGGKVNKGERFQILKKGVWKRYP